ncbi:MAG: hypothetical protein GY820_32815 [Gammaproteobacteria bacterium]|nr:hypothetical protein [Gammaproteobacteria bacterium]
MQVAQQARARQINRKPCFAAFLAMRALLDLGIDMVDDLFEDNIDQGASFMLLMCLSGDL